MMTLTCMVMVKKIIIGGHWRNPTNGQFFFFFLHWQPLAAMVPDGHQIPLSSAQRPVLGFAMAEEDRGRMEHISVFGLSSAIAVSGTGLEGADAGERGQEVPYTSPLPGDHLRGVNGQ